MTKMETIIPASTVVLLRDSRQGMETLLLRRSKALAFGGGMWVFPGGRIDPQDYSDEGPDDTESAARRAAVREAGEEAGVHLNPCELVCFSRWTTPEESPRRYDTWFFVTAVNAAKIKVDGSEIQQYRWLRPPEALELQRADRIRILPPTFVTLQELTRFNRAAAVLDYSRESPPSRFLPRIAMVPGGMCLLYQEDAGYDAEAPDTPGARHRFWMLEKGWHYEKEMA